MHEYYAVQDVLLDILPAPYELSAQQGLKLPKTVDFTYKTGSADSRSHKSFHSFTRTGIRIPN